MLIYILNLTPFVCILSYFYMCGSGSTKLLNTDPKHWVLFSPFVLYAKFRRIANFSFPPDYIHVQRERQAEQADQHSQLWHRAAHHHLRQPEKGLYQLPLSLLRNNTTRRVVAAILF